MSQPAKACVLESRLGPSFAGGPPAEDELAELSTAFVTPHPGHLLAYWGGKCTDDDIPMRAQLHPSEMKSLLERIAIWERTDDGRDNRIRLMGTLVAGLFDRDPSGERVTAVFPETWVEAFGRISDELYGSKRPAYLCYSLAPLGRSHAKLEHLALPLRRNGGEAVMSLHVFARIPPVPGGAGLLGI